MLTKEAFQELFLTQAIYQANQALEKQDQTNALVSLPKDYNVHDLEKFLPHRRRQRGTMNTPVAAHFARYVHAKAEPGAGVFVNQDSMRAIAVLNAGTVQDPGHGDNLAIYAPPTTAAYDALRSINNVPLSQQTAAEFMEDWIGHLTFFHENETLAPNKAVAAVRRISIENLKKVESSEQQLSQSKGVLESVTASSVEQLPTFIYFKCVPHLGFTERTFVMRLGIVTGGDKPRLTLRMVKQELHQEEMADELVAIVVREIESHQMPADQKSAFSIPVMQGNMQMGS